MDDGAATSIQHFQRASIAALANTAGTGILGTAFWLVAARLYPESEIGAAVAASSLLIAVSFIAQLNLWTSISRFLPAAGTTQKDMVRHTYVLTTVLSVVLGVVAIAIGELRGGELIDGGNRWLTLAFAVSIPIWTVFTLQDAVLVAVRRSTWVPIENFVVAAVKFGLLPLFVFATGGSGVLIAWVLPSLVAIFVVTRALYGGLLADGSERFDDRAAYLRYSLADFPGTLAYLLALRVVPLAVVEKLGSEEGAYVGLAWTIISVAAFALPAVSRGLLVELSHEGSDAARLLRRAVQLVVFLVLPICVVGALASTPILSLAGADYARVGGVVLAFGVLGLAPAALAECGLAALRHEDRVGLASTLQIVRAVIVVGGVAGMLWQDQVRGIGVAFLVANVVCAALVLWFVRPERTGDRSTSEVTA